MKAKVIYFVCSCVLFAVLLLGCAPSPVKVENAVKETMGAWTQVPTQTAFPTYTPFPTHTPEPSYTPAPTYTPVPTKVIVVTPTNMNQTSVCKPITGLDYSDNSKIAIKLQAYVSDLPGVRTVSYVIPERLYSNSLSQLYHVTYVDEEDGKVYSKRYLVYVKEFGWKNGTFSMDGQCWIDPPD